MNRSSQIKQVNKAITDTITEHILFDLDSATDSKEIVRKLSIKIFYMIFVQDPSSMIKISCTHTEATKEQIKSGEVGFAIDVWHNQN